jgi:hypothetical protein
MKQPTSPAHPCSGTSTAWRGRPCRMTCVAACHPFARKKGTSMNTYLPSQAAHILMHQLSCMHRVHGAGLVQTGHAHITPCTKCSGTASLDQLSPTPDITQQQNQQAQACHYPLCNATLHMQPLGQLCTQKQRPKTAAPVHQTTYPTHSATPHCTCSPWDSSAHKNRDPRQQHLYIKRHINTTAPVNATGACGSNTVSIYTPATTTCYKRKSAKERNVCCQSMTHLGNQQRRCCLQQQPAPATPTPHDNSTNAVTPVRRSCCAVLRAERDRQGLATAYRVNEEPRTTGQKETQKQRQRF